MSTIILLTDGFPFGQSEPFLEAELPYLVGTDARVILVPTQPREGGISKSIPPGVEVEPGLLEHLGPAWATRRRRGELLRPRVIKECLRWWPHSLKRRAVFRILDVLSKATITRDWLLSYVVTHGHQSERIVFYAYWCQSYALGACWAAQRLPFARVVSRAHGYDVYEERQDPPAWPYRHEMFSLIDRVFTVSEHGLSYFRERYPVGINRCAVSRLGVEDPGFSTPASMDGGVRLVSCSNCVSLKRIDLLVKGLALAAQQLPKQVFHWEHYGSGPCEEAWRKLAGDLLGDRVRWRMNGRVSRQDLFLAYREGPVDALVNVSSSEGVPVSIMEAQSCGIPVIATAVGGTPELVSNRNGILLSDHPLPEEIARAIKSVSAFSNFERDEARATWDMKSRADTVYPRFVEDLLNDAAPGA